MKVEGLLPHPDALCRDNIKMLKKLFQACQTKHERCRRLRESLSPKTLPRYLLDLTAYKDGQVRLFETKGATGMISYAALSYCWGRNCEKIHKQKTLEKNFQARLHGFPLKDLPKTLRHAARVCRIIGLRYLWVDAVCIIQDGNDLQRQVRDMIQAYKAASLVISAARASNADEGFLGCRLQEYKKYELPITFHFPDRTETGRVRVTQRIPEEHLEPIDLRGWTWQEHLAAIGLIRFESEELVWRCPTMNKYESDIRVKGRVVQRYDRDSCFRQYLEQVRIYSRRETEEANDRLTAFEISAMLVAELLGLNAEDYQAGLWKPDLCRQLLWICDADHPRGLSKNMASFPSWTWANAQLPVQWDNDNADMQDLDWGDYTCDVESCTTELVEPDRPFGSVKGGMLTVRAYAPEAFWTGRYLIELPKAVRRSPRLRGDGQGGRKTASSSYEGVSKSRRGQHMRSIRPRNLRFRPTWDTLQPPPEQVVKCLEIRSGIGNVNKAYGIVLVSAGEGLFKRIGYFCLEHPTRRRRGGPAFPRAISYNWIHQVKKETIRII